MKTLLHASDELNTSSIDPTTVSYQVDTTHQLVARLGDALAGLENRIGSISAPSPPAIASDCKPVKGCECEIAIRIQNSNDQIGSLIHMVERMTMNVRL